MHCPTKVLLVTTLLFAVACGGTDATSSASYLTNPTPTASGPTTSTPPTLTASTPSVPSNAIGTGLSGLGLVSDDYTQYASTAALLANISSNSNGGTGNPATSKYSYVDNGNLLELDPTMTFNGHPTAKYNMPGGSASVPQLQVYFPGNKVLTDMWLRVTIRFSPGWTTDGTLTNSGKGYKLLGWAWDSGDGRGSVEFGPVTDMTIGWYVFRPAGSSMGPILFSQTVPTAWRNGTDWYDVVVHYQQTSSTTVRQQWWMGINGTHLILQGDETGTMAPGQTVPNVNRIMLGMNFNQIRAANQTQALWYGQWEVIDGSQHANPFGL